MQEFYGTQSKYEPVVDYDRKTGPSTRLHRDIELERARVENGGPGGPGEGTVGPDGRPEPSATLGSRSYGQ